MTTEETHTAVTTSSAAEHPGLADSSVRPSESDRLRSLAQKMAMPFVFALAVAVFSVLSPGQFLTSTNLNSILSAQAVPLILAVGVIFPLRAGHFDLSIAQIMVLSGAICGTLTVLDHWPVLPALLLAVGASILCGALNGLLIVVFGLNSFVVTLGTSSVFGGITYAITRSQSIQPMPAAIETLANKTVLGEPLLVWYAWILAAILWVVLELSPLGRYLLFVGGNPRTAELVGIRTRSLGLLTYLIAALLAAFAGVLLAGSLDTVNPTIGAEFLLTPYAAAFLGAAAIQIGRFNVLGTVLAVYLVAVGQTGLILLGSPSWVSQVFEGGILVAAIGFSRVVRRRA
jgi:ribose transport system permease protein